MNDHDEPHVFWGMIMIALTDLLMAIWNVVAHLSHPIEVTHSIS